MRDIALRYTGSFGNQRGDQITIRVIAYHQIRTATQLRQRFTFNVVSEILKIWPDLETRYPVTNNFSIFLSKWYSYDPTILSTGTFLEVGCTSFSRSGIRRVHIDVGSASTLAKETLGHFRSSART